MARGSLEKTFSNKEFESFEWYKTKSDKFEKKVEGRKFGVERGFWNPNPDDWNGIFGKNSQSFNELEKTLKIENENYERKKCQADEFLERCKSTRPDLWKTPEQKNGTYILPLPEHPSMKLLKDLRDSGKRNYFNSFSSGDTYNDWRTHFYEGF